jgi:ubiquinone/menaquinone biosynthesis C-methylase UbiE
MITRIGTKDRKKVGKFYDNIYHHGGYLSHYVYNKQMLKLLKITSTDGKRPKLLDIACGQGTLLALAEEFAETYGVDISKEAIKKASQNAKLTKFKVASAEKLPFKANQFDFVTCMGSMEHFYDMDKALREMRRVAKPGAKIMIHVPNSKYLVHRILRIDTQGQINERLATEREWKKVIEKYFRVEKVHKYNTRWFLEWIPKRYCCHFTLICRKEN